MRTAVMYGLGAILLLVIYGCTVSVELEPMALSDDTPLPFLGGMERIPLDLSDNAQFIQYQDRFRGFDSVSFSLKALNLSGSDQQLRVYASRSGELTAETAPTLGTWLATVDVPMLNTVQDLHSTLGQTAREGLEEMLRASPPVFYVYVISEADSTLGLAVSNITFEPGSAHFSIFRITADGETTEVEIRLAE